MQEHPEDAAVREAAERYAAAKIKTFCERHRAEIDRLITTYADEDARELLAQLRARFWDGF